MPTKRLQHCEGGHTPFVQGRKNLSPVQRQLSPNHAFLERFHSRRVGAVSVIKVRSLVGLSNHSTFHQWSFSPEHHTCVVVKWTDELFCSGYKWVSQFETLCICTRCTGERLSEAGVQAPWHSVLETVWLHCDEATRLDACEDGKVFCCCRTQASVTIRKALLMAGSIWWVWALQHQTEHSTLQLNVPGLGWLFTTLLLQHPSQSQQAASRVQHVMSAFCEVTQALQWHQLGANFGISIPNHTTKHKLILFLLNIEISYTGNTCIP